MVKFDVRETVQNKNLMLSEVQYHCLDDEIEKEIKILYFKQTVFIYIYNYIFYLYICTDIRPSDRRSIVKRYLQITIFFFRTFTSAP